MKKINKIIALATVILMAATMGTQIAAATTDDQVQYIFYEDFSNVGALTDFDYSEIGETWLRDKSGIESTNCIRGNGNGGNELAIRYKLDGSQAESSVTAFRDTSPGDASVYYSAYGYYEACIKFPQNNGVVSRFEIIGADSRFLVHDGSFTSKPLGYRGDDFYLHYSQICIIEAINTTTKEVKSYCGQYGMCDVLVMGEYYYDSDWNAIGEWWESKYEYREQCSFNRNTSEVDIYDGQFHKIGLKWTPSRYTFYIDDVVVGEWIGETSSEETYVNFIMTRSGNAPNTSDVAEMVIDYVFVRELTEKEMLLDNNTIEDEDESKEEDILEEDEEVLKEAVLTGADASAYVIKNSGNQNTLVITVTETFSDGTTIDNTETFLIRNNSAGEYTVQGAAQYKVYVDTKGNNQIRACLLDG